MADPDTHGDATDVTLRKRFESAWASGRPEPIERFLPDEEDAGYLAVLEELVHVELEFAWLSWGKTTSRAATAPMDETIAGPPRVETYLQRFPRLDQPETVRRLVQQEWTVRKQCGQSATVEEYRRRFPQLEIAVGEFDTALPMLSECGDDARFADTLAGSRPGGATAGKIESGRLGNYEILEEIGRGGMGVVYRARQRTADRIVAIKVIQLDRLEALPRDTQTSTLDRFRHEAQAAAKLEHEHIVTVYEVGEVEGQPFFSMRYVEGRDLAEIVREGPIENRRAAAYMEPVARAVHEAHCLGILHRDLKPQNILVDAKTDRALVADFGLAKLSQQSDELTRAGEVMGTPSYMSPEQAKDSATVTAQADTYALGATLYQVLTARPPFQAATPLETLRQVMDEEPAPPRHLNRSIDRDLETICLKCLEKEPSRRYESAETLADDLRRYLAGEPILARPIGTLGRTYRWCRRNPVMASLVALTATFLVVALVATFVGYVTAEAARRQAEESFQQAQGAVDDFFTFVSEDTLLNEPGMQPLRRKLLTKALGYYRQFLSQRGEDPTIRDELAMAHFRVGLITEEVGSPQEALASLLRARDMQQQLVSERPHDRQRLRAIGNTFSAIGKALRRQGKPDKALAAHRRAVEFRLRLTKAAPREAEFRRMLASSYMNIGIIQREAGHAKEARRRLEEAQALRRELLRTGHDNPEIRRDLGMGWFNLANLAMSDGDAVGAEENLKSAIEQFENLLDRDPRGLANQKRLVICYRILADLKAALRNMADDETSALGLYEEALDLYRKALQQMDTLARANPDVPEYQADLAGLHMNLGLLHSDQQLPAVALESYRQAHDILDTLAETRAKVPRYRRDLAATLREMAGIQSAQEQRSAARANLETAQKHLRRLVEQFPNDSDHTNLLQKTTADLERLDATPPQP